MPVSLVSVLAISRLSKLETKVPAIGEELAFLVWVHLVKGSFDFVSWHAFSGAYCENKGAPLVRDYHRPAQVCAKVSFQARN